MSIYAAAAAAPLTQRTALNYRLKPLMQSRRAAPPAAKKSLSSLELISLRFIGSIIE